MSGARSSPRASISLALAVAVPAVLLGLGWLAASMRERASRLREEEARLIGIAASVRSAIDEGLEELRRREDERPFYLYHHYYSPSDVLAITDPVAVSPLAAAPSDRRIVGWFQIDPEGVVSTPHDGEPEIEERLRTVHAIASHEVLADLRALVAGREGGALVARSAEPQPEPAPQVAADNVTVALNAYAVQLASEIQQAQQGNVEAYDRVAQRGRAAPITTRRSIGIEEIQQQQAVGIRPRRVVAARRAPTVPRAEPSPPLVPTSIEVDYTPMAWRVEGDVVTLTRVVSHEGAAVLQGVVLDRRELVRRWIPEVIGRLGPTPTPQLLENVAGTSCALTGPASRTLTELHLCFAAGSLEPDAALDAELGWQLGALLALVFVVALAALSIARASRRAEQLAMQRSAFVSAVSHELRTPLTTIRMHAEMLEEGLVEPQRTQRVYGEIAAESVRLSRLVENVLELSRLDEGRRPLRRREGDLSAHVREIVAAQAPFARARGFDLRAVGGEPVELSFDAQAVEQIVVNLIDNAVKYAAGHGEPVIEIEVLREGELAVIVVSDRGPGIPPADRLRVFDRFVRVERPEDEHKPGTGIGLSLVRDLSRAHGGDAEAGERPGGGCRIRVTLRIT